MKKLRQLFTTNTEAGFTLVELIVSLVITGILAVGLTQILTITMQTVGYTQTTTLVASNVALLDSTLSKDISNSNGFVIPNTSTTPDATKICTSWVATDTSYTNVRPLVTLSVPRYLPITKAVGNGLTITYTLATGTTNAFVVGQLATIYGFTTASLSMVSAPVTVVTSGSFTVSTTASTTETETPAKNGTAAVNFFHGYEVRNVANAGELWNFTCPVTGFTTNLTNTRVLRQGVPLPAVSSWNAAIACTSFSSGSDKTITPASASSTICPTDTSLTSLTVNPGIQFSVPAATTGSRSNQTYTAQVVQGARSIA